MPSLTFLGAARTVTGSKYLLEVNDRRVLVDCGLFQGLKELRQLNWQPLPGARVQHPRGRPHPRPHRPQRLPAAAVRRGLPRAGVLHARARPTSARSCCPTPGGSPRKTRARRTGTAIRSTPRAAAVHRGRRLPRARQPPARRLRPADPGHARSDGPVRELRPPPGIRLRRARTRRGWRPRGGLQRRRRALRPADPARSAAARPRRHAARRIDLRRSRARAGQRRRGARADRVGDDCARREDHHSGVCDRPRRGSDLLAQEARGRRPHSRRCPSSWTARWRSRR